MSLARQLGAYAVEDRPDQSTQAQSFVFRSNSPSELLRLVVAPASGAPFPIANGDVEMRTLFANTRSTYPTSSPYDFFRRRVACSVLASKSSEASDSRTLDAIRGFYSGSFAHKTSVHRPTDFDIPQPRASTAPVAGLGVQAEPPLISVIWSLVENQRTRAARVLLRQLPDDRRYDQVKTLLRQPTTSTSPRRDRNRAREYEWLRQHANEYRGRWVAVSGAGLVATAHTLRDLRQRLQATGEGPTALVHYVE
jgi:hypothetical protein